ncbi:hypothetical protein IG631_23600 [Alternaria alternata]|nr:hypothetical protein IG631_23600 [Alternaria alternata]
MLAAQAGLSTIVRGGVLVFTIFDPQQSRLMGAQMQTQRRLARDVTRVFAGVRQPHCSRLERLTGLSDGPMHGAHTMRAVRTSPKDLPILHKLAIQLPAAMWL